MARVKQIYASEFVFIDLYYLSILYLYLGVVIIAKVAVRASATSADAKPTFQYISFKIQ